MSMNQEDYIETKEIIKRSAKWALLVITVLMVFSITMCSFGTIKAGNRGVILTFGKVSPTILNEGIYFIVPMAQRVKTVNVQIQKSQTTAEAASKDLQDTYSTIAINYHVNPAKANVLYQQIGIDYKAVIIDPTVQEVMKAVAAEYTAIELINKRETVSVKIKEGLRHRLLAYNLIVDDFSIINFKFSKEFSHAIEEKQTAEQNAMKAKNDLERIKIEAEQKIASAKAEAESLRLQKENVTDNLIQLRQIEAQIMAIKRWNGVLPQFTGTVTPFIDVSVMKAK